MNDARTRTHSLFATIKIERNRNNLFIKRTQALNLNLNEMKILQKQNEFK